MTQEPTAPAIFGPFCRRTSSTTQVREAMIDLQNPLHALHTQMIHSARLAAKSRSDLPAAEIAHVFPPDHSARS